MYKLIVVDDEKLIREGIVKGNPWHEWGFEVVGLASNGLEAIDLVKQTNPDVVLSDIRMPKMDGIGLMEYLNKHHASIRIVILSGYNDFEYLNKSIKNNVTDYLLKPTEEEDFSQLFLSLKEKLDVESEKKAYLKELEDHYIRMERILCAQEMDRLLKGYDLGGLEKIRHIEKVTQLSLQDMYVVACHVEGYSIDENSQVGYSEIEDMPEWMNSNHPFQHAFFYLDTSGHITGVINQSHDTYLEFQNQLKAYIKYEISIGVSTVCSDVHSLPRCYEEARCCLMQRQFIGIGKVIQYNEILEEDEWQTPMFMDEQLIQSGIMSGRLDIIKDEVEKFFAAFENKLVKNPRMLDQLLRSFMFRLASWSLESGVQLEHILYSLDLNYASLENEDKLIDKQEMLLSIIIELIEIMDQVTKGSKNQGLIDRILKVVNETYQENDISLDAVAEKVKKSPAYISKLFKKELGYNFTDYVTKRRMEDAKKLLEDITVKVYEIAEALGYADVSNFIKVF